MMSVVEYGGIVLLGGAASRKVSRAAQFSFVGLTDRSSIDIVLGGLRTPRNESHSSAHLLLHKWKVVLLPPASLVCVDLRPLRLSFPCRPLSLFCVFLSLCRVRAAMLLAGAGEEPGAAAAIGDGVHAPALVHSPGPQDLQPPLQPPGGVDVWCGGLWSLAGEKGVT